MTNVLHPWTMALLEASRKSRGIALSTLRMNSRGNKLNPVAIDKDGETESNLEATTARNRTTSCNLLRMKFPTSMPQSKG
jgi:hypothetical protein